MRIKALSYSMLYLHPLTYSTSIHWFGAIYYMQVQC